MSRSRLERKGEKNLLSAAYAVRPFSGLHQMDFFSAPELAHDGAEGNAYLSVRSPPRGGRLRFGIDGLKLRLAADRQTGRLGTPRSQACLDRSSPVSGCCGLMLSGGREGGRGGGG